MAEINWIASTAKNFSDPTAWDGGVAPGINDTAMFTNTGGGSCTLDIEPVIGGLKILTNYSGIFSQNSKPMSIGKNGTGQLWIQKSSVPLDARIDFYGNDIYSSIPSGSAELIIWTETDIRLTGNYPKLSIAETGRLKPHNTPHPELGSTPNQQFGATTLINDGTLDCSQFLSSTSPQLRPSTMYHNGTLIAPPGGITLAVQNMYLGAGHSVTGKVFIHGISGRAPNLRPGDYRSFAGISSDAGIAITLQNGHYDMPDFVPGDNVTVTSGVTATWYGDVIFTPAVISLPFSSFTLAGTADQTLDIGNNTVGLASGKPAGIVTLTSGDYTLVEDSDFGDGINFGPYYPGCFKQNGKTMSISSEKLHLLDIAPAQYELSGDLRFSGKDFVLKNTVLPDDSVLVFTAHCTARLISENGKQCSLGGIRVEQNTQLVVVTTNHSSVTGGVLDEMEISGDMAILGTLCFYDPGQYRIVMSGEGKVCHLGKLITGSQSEIIIEPKSNAVQPIDLDVAGNVHLYWGPEVTTVQLLPGNYQCFPEICVPSHVSECRLSSGEYDFNVLCIATPPTGEVQLTQNGEGNIVLRGQTVIAGHGLCRNAIDYLHLEHLQLNALLVFAELMQIDHPVVPSGKITGNDKLILSGTRPFQLNDNALDVGELHIFDSDGGFPVPAPGYRSLTLEARNCSTFMTLRSEYRVAALTMMTDTHTLSIDVDQTTTIRCSGEIATQKNGNGNIRWDGGGLETWILEGDASQTLDMNFEHGYHVLGTMFNDKSGGTLSLASPLCVTDYRKPDGTPLPAPVNMTILSALSMQCQLHLAMDGTGEWLSQEGTRLESGTVIAGGTVVFYARLADQDGQPVNPNLVEKIWVSCALMNPTAPYLHAPRRIVVRDLELDIPRVLSPDWQTDEKRLPEGQTYNFCVDSAMFRELRFEQPGLYYVTFAVKMFGKMNALPFRYEILCERPSM